MKSKIRLAAIATLLSTILASNAHAVFIGWPDIIPSTSLTHVGAFSINKIADGLIHDISPYNGFVSNSAAGTITLDLGGTYNLTDFRLWNDVNILSEGIKDFRLDYYSPSNTLLGTSGTLVGPISQAPGEDYSLGTIPGVSRVDLVVLNSHVGVFTRIEIREVGFFGTPVPEPGVSTILAAMGLGAIGVRRSRKR